MLNFFGTELRKGTYSKNNYMESDAMPDDANEVWTATKLTVQLYFYKRNLAWFHWRVSIGTYDSP